MKSNHNLRIKERKRMISDRIKEIRREKGWTQVELSEKANVSLATVRNIEQGSSGYSSKVLKKIATALEIHPPDLVDMAKGEQRESERKRAKWTGREYMPTKEDEEFGEGLNLFFNELVKKVPPQVHEILFDIDNFFGFQEFLNLAIDYDVSLPDGILPKGNRKK